MIISDMIRLRRHIDDILKARTPYRKYLDEMQKILTDYSLKNSKIALDRTYEFMLTHQLNDTSIAQIPYIVSDIFLKDKQGLKAIKDKLQELTGPLYYYNKPILKLSDDEIMAIDQETIKMLTEAEMLWILDYANNVQIARDITRIMTDSKAAGLDMTETARALKAELSSYTPSEFAKRFGEEKYWKLVNHNATFRTKSYATINQLDFAGVKEYQWITRGAEACPICVPYDNKIFNVSDAKGRMTAYFDAAKEGSVINMQKADPFLDLDEALLNPDGIMGMMPPIHHWCYCEIVIYYTNEVQPEEPKPEEKEPTKEEIDNYLRNNVDIRMREELRRQFKANPELISKILKNNPSLKFKLDKISIEHAKYSRKHNEITFRKKEFIEQRALKHEVGHSFDKLSPLGKTITSDYLDVQNAFNKDKIQIIDKVKSNPEGFQKAMKSDPKYTDGIQDTIDSMIYDSDLKVKTLFGHEPKYWNYKEQLSLNNVKYDIYLKKNGELFADYYELRQNGSIAGLNTYTELFPELSKVLDKWYKTL